LPLGKKIISTTKKIRNLQPAMGFSLLKFICMIIFFSHVRQNYWESGRRKEKQFQAKKVGGSHSMWNTLHQICQDTIPSTLFSMLLVVKRKGKIVQQRRTGSSTLTVFREFWKLWRWKKKRMHYYTSSGLYQYGITKRFCNRGKRQKRDCNWTC
jgi:hypothetical protein